MEIIYLPSYRSHVIEPANLGVFSMLKQYFREKIAPYAHLPASLPIYKRRFLAAYIKARKKTLRPKIITTAFRKLGL